MKKLIAVAVFYASASQAATLTYPLTLHDNGPLGLGQFLISGASADLADSDDSTGVFYPYTANIYGGPVAGAFGARAVDDGRLQPTDLILVVRVWLRVKCLTPDGNHLEGFTHRDDNLNNPGPWNALQWRSFPLVQAPPLRAPSRADVPVPQDEWTWVQIRPLSTAVSTSWTTHSIFQHCFGLWAVVPPNGGVIISEGWLEITTSQELQRTPKY